MSHFHSPMVRRKSQYVRSAPTGELRIRNTETLSSSNQLLQRKVRVGPAHDPLEAEADRAADAVLSGNQASVSSISAAPSTQKKCAQCSEEGSAVIRRQPEKEEEMLQAKAGPGGLIQRQEEEEEEMLQTKVKPGGTCSACSRSVGDSAASAVSSGGRPLSESERSYFEPRFGQDFSDVNVHTHSSAERAAGNINARAYTLGNNIAFGSGQFSPNSSSGRHLLAHELAHVVQQKQGDQNNVQRKVSIFSNCKPNKHGAPKEPLQRIKRIEGKAEIMTMLLPFQFDMAKLEKESEAVPFRAFRERFGPPPAAGKMFKDRFNGKKFKTKNEAFKSEIRSALKVTDKISDRFSKPIVYRCPGLNKKIKIENCEDECLTNDIAFVCTGTHMRDMAICPKFWKYPDNQLAGAMIHEVVHARFNRPGHPTAIDQRHKNPECYTSLIADIYGFTPGDKRCPKVT